MVFVTADSYVHTESLIGVGLYFLRRHLGWWARAFFFRLQSSFILPALPLGAGSGCAMRCIPLSVRNIRCGCPLLFSVWYPTPGRFCICARWSCLIPHKNPSIQVPCASTPFDRIWGFWLLCSRLCAEKVFALVLAGTLRACLFATFSSSLCAVLPGRFILRLESLFGQPLMLRSIFLWLGQGMANATDKGGIIHGTCVFLGEDKTPQPEGQLERHA